MMHTPHVIVDGKSATGKRLSVSIDEALWTLYLASRGFSSQKARRDLRNLMHNDQVSNSYEARCWIYREIANPVLLLAPEDDTPAATQQQPSLSEP